MARQRATRSLPSRRDILDFIARTPVPPDERTLLRHFKVGPRDRVALKGLLKSIAREPGAVSAPSARSASTTDFVAEQSADAKPAAMAVVVFDRVDADGDLYCRPLTGTAGIIVAADRAGRAAQFGPGDRAVARIERRPDGTDEAILLRRLEPEGERVVGLFRAEREGGGRIEPADRRDRTVYRVRAEEALGAADGDLVEAVALPLPRLGLPHAQVLNRIGRPDDPGAISLLTIRRLDIPTAFSEAALAEAALAEAAAARPVGPEGRIDLRTLDLVTIDGPDARDFDDAVWAEPDPDVADGWHAVVAIADVAHYVRPGSALDIAAQERGNSVYFPDRVVPMLPEALSNELCSLKPHEDRACLAAHLWIDGTGTLIRHRIVRGLMRSIARLTYEEVQAARDGYPSPRAAPLLDCVIGPLYGVFRALSKARDARGTLDLDLPERQVILGADGRIDRIVKRQRLDSHRLIEELMIAANVAAAETLEAARTPALYRVHDAPDPVRLDALRTVLDEIGASGLRLAKGQVVRPAHFSHLLAEAAGRPEADLINELVLRAQAQAQYAPGNIGHFGLALRRYAHFTSPIRRYADLVVHRALIAALGLGTDGEIADAERLALVGKQLGATERRAAQAERGALDRYVASFLEHRLSESFIGRVSGVARFGLFVTLDETGADGLIPISLLPADYYHHDANRHVLEGRRTRRRFTLGDRVEVSLVAAQPLTGSLQFALIGDEPASERPAVAPGARKFVARKPRPRGKAGPAP